jgi:hypothetical protein
VESVIQELKDFDNLDPDFVLSIANRLQLIEPFVRALAHVQNASEWINYESITDPGVECDRLNDQGPEGCWIDAVQIHEDVLLFKPNTYDMSKGDKDNNKKKCLELVNLFDSLHEIFDQVRTKKGDLEGQFHSCKDQCITETFNSAKESDTSSRL